MNNPVLGRLLLCLFCFLSLTAGCGKSMQKKITGKWVIDSENELFEMMGDDEVASEENQKFVLEFQSAGVFRSTVNSSGHTQTKEGRWFFLEGEGDICRLKVSINSDKPDLDPDIVLTEIKFVDEETIELVPPNLDVIKQKMVFRKSR